MLKKGWQNFKKLILATTIDEVYPVTIEKMLWLKDELAIRQAVSSSADFAACFSS